EERLLEVGRIRKIVVEGARDVLDVPPRPGGQHPVIFLVHAGLRLDRSVEQRPLRLLRQAIEIAELLGIGLELADRLLLGEELLAEDLFRAVAALEAHAPELYAEQ